MHLYTLIDPFALRQDGSKPLTANWDAGPYKLTARQLESDVAIGTAPLIVASTTLVTNLNADLWDGYQFADYLNQAVKTTSSPTFVTGTFTDIAVDTDLIRTNSATNCVGINILNSTHALEITGEFYLIGNDGSGGAAPTAFEVIGGVGDATYNGGLCSLTGGAGGGAYEATAGTGGAVGLYAGAGGPGTVDDLSGDGGNIILSAGAAGADGGGGVGTAGYIDVQSDLYTGSRILLTAPALTDIAIGGFGNYSLYFQTQTNDKILSTNWFTKKGDGEDSCYFQIYGVGTPSSLTNVELLWLGYNSTGPVMRIWSYAGGTGTVRPIKIYTGANTDQFILLATGNNTMAGNLKVGSFAAGDATNYTEIKTDGEINLHGTARVINHVVIHAGAFKLVGLKPAVVDNEGVFITLDFVHTSETEAYASQFIPFRWDSDTDVEIAIDWLCDVDATGGDVTWAVEYLARKDNEEVGAAGTTITQSFTGAGAGLNQRSTFTTKLLKANLQADDILGVRIYRDHDNVGDTLNETARFLALHFHFVRDKIGEATT